MKTTEVPEKIYLTSNENGTHYYTESQPFERKYVEYICKDAFIEKAVKWLKNLFFEYENLTDYNPTEDFKKYMKGE